MLVIGRAMMARPKLMLIDEPSLGLAPLMVDEVFAVLKSLIDAGVTLLVVEQNARVALQLADYGYVMDNCHIVLEGAGDELRNNAAVRHFSIVLNIQGERKSYRDGTHDRTRKP